MGAEQAHHGFLWAVSARAIFLGYSTYRYVRLLRQDSMESCTFSTLFDTLIELFLLFLLSSPNHPVIISSCPLIICPSFLYCYMGLWIFLLKLSSATLFYQGSDLPFYLRVGLLV